MTEHIESFADTNRVHMQEAALARNWFESQASQFRLAQMVVALTGSDVDTIRGLRQQDEIDTGVGVYSKAIDAIETAHRQRKFARMVPGTDIYRQHSRNATVELLGVRASNAMVQADRREYEHLSSIGERSTIIDKKA